MKTKFKEAAVEKQRDVREQDKVRLSSQSRSMKTQRSKLIKLIHSDVSNE